MVRSRTGSLQGVLTQVALPLTRGVGLGPLLSPLQVELPLLTMMPLTVLTTMPSTTCQGRVSKAHSHPRRIYGHKNPRTNMGFVPTLHALVGEEQFGARPGQLCPSPA